MKAITDDEVNRTELPQKAFSQEDLDNYLDKLKIKPKAGTKEKPAAKYKILNPDNMANLNDND